MLLRPHRITDSEDFSRVRRYGRAVPHPFVVVTWTPTNSTKTRFGFSVSKKVGKAVVRNSVKRRLREVARRELPNLVEGYDIVMTARPDAARADWDQLYDAVCRALRRGRLYAVHGSPHGIAGDNSQAPQGTASSTVLRQKP